MLNGKIAAIKAVRKLVNPDPLTAKLLVEDIMDFGVRQFLIHELIPEMTRVAEPVGRVKFAVGRGSNMVIRSNVAIRLLAWLTDNHPTCAIAYIGPLSHRGLVHVLYCVNARKADERPMGYFNWGNKWVRADTVNGLALLMTCKPRIEKLVVSTRQSMNRKRQPIANHGGLPTGKFTRSGWAGNHPEGMSRNAANAVAMVTGEYPKTAADGMRVFRGLVRKHRDHVSHE